MSTEEIEQAIIDSGADITEVELGPVKACTVEVRGRAHVAINRRLSERQKKAGLAHELGHLRLGGLYTADTPTLLRARAEALASRYAAETLAPPEEVAQAAQEGCVSVWDFAERFEVPLDVMARILTSYKCRNGI